MGKTATDRSNQECQMESQKGVWQSVECQQHVEVDGPLAPSEGPISFTLSSSLALESSRPDGNAHIPHKGSCRCTSASATRPLVPWVNTPSSRCPWSAEINLVFKEYVHYPMKTIIYEKRLKLTLSVPFKEGEERGRTLGISWSAMTAVSLSLFYS